MKIFKKLDKKRLFLLNVLFLFIFIVFLIPEKVLALDIPHLLSGLLIPIISGLGKLLTVLINLLITVAQYNEFINSAAVSRGWIIIRDICNMFFIIVILIIAFATVLNIEKYSYKRLMGTFLLAAVLVNFSKLICGVLIDASQILMLTFVKAFSAAAEGNFIKMLGLDKILMLNASESISDTDVVGALLLGFIMTVVALIVIGIMTIILVFRIVILWFLVLLSPLAFVTSILPDLQKYSNQWWQKFTSQVIIGPVMAFFIWLSLVVVSGNTTGTSLLGVDTTDSRFQTLEEIEELRNSDEPLTIDQILNIQTEATISEAGQPQYILNFMIGIAMLMGSLLIAQEMGVAGGKMAGNMVGKMQAMASGAAKLPLKTLGLGRKGLARAGKTIGEVIHAKTGIPVLPSEIKRQYKVARTKLTYDRWEEGSKKRALIQRQWEKNGWIPGTVRFAQDVVGVGKRRIKQGTENLEEVKEIRDKEGNAITEDEKKEFEQNKDILIKEQETHVKEKDDLYNGLNIEDKLEEIDADKLENEKTNLVQNRDLNKNDLESLDKDLTMDTHRLVPLIKIAIQTLEKEADQAKADGDADKAESLDEEALLIMESLSSIEKKDKFEGKEIFEGKSNLKELVKTELQNNLNSTEERIKDIDIELKPGAISPEEKEEAKLDTKIFIPLINKAIKNLEDEAEDAEISARGEKKDEKKKEYLEKVQDLRRQIENAKQALPGIEETDSFEYKEIFKGNLDLEESVQADINKKIDLDQEKIDNINIGLKKEVISSEEKEKLEKDLTRADNLEEIGLARIQSGKDISQPYGEYDIRVTGDEEEKRKLAELPKIYEQTEFIALANKARTEENDWAKYKAILKLMAGKGDWNEILLDDKYNSNTRGKLDYAHFLADEFEGVRVEDAQGLVHELGTLAMNVSNHRIDSPYLYKEVVPNSGVYDYQEKTEGDEKQAYLYFSSIPDQEKRARGESRLGTFSERPVIIINDKGEEEVVGRAPILDELFGTEFIRSYPSYIAEIARARLNKDKTWYLGAPETMKYVRENVLPIAEKEFGKDDLQIFKDTIRKLELTWRKLGRPDPTKVPEGKVDIRGGESDQENEKLKNEELKKFDEKRKA